MKKAQQMGIENYTAEQAEKVRLLTDLLDRYNDGRQKTRFCLAVNLLELDEVTEIVRQADAETQGMALKDKAAFLSSLLQSCAEKKGIKLKLRKKKP